MLGVEPLKPHDASSGLHVADQRCVTTYAPREAPASTRPLITAGAGGGAGAGAGCSGAVGGGWRASAVAWRSTARTPG